MLSARRHSSGQRLGFFLGNWVPACLVLLLVQATVLGAQEGLTLVTYTPSAGRLSARFSLRKKSALPLYPEMNSDRIAALMKRGGPIAVGPEGELGDERRIYGQLSAPLGRHYLIPLAPSVTADELDRWRSSASLEYVLWLRSLPLPPALAQRATVVETGTPFILLQLTSGSNPAPAQIARY